MAIIGRDSNGNPVVLTPDQVLQALYWDVQGGTGKEVHNEQPTAAGEADITFTAPVALVIVSSTVDVYVDADNAGGTSATAGFYVPAKVPTTLPFAVQSKLNVYATAAGTVTAIGRR